MTSRTITLYLHVHQPYRLRPYTVFDTGINHDYFEDHTSGADTNNAGVFNKVADKSYRPMNALLKKLLATHPEFRLSLSISGTFIEQAEQWGPDVLRDFKELVATGRVEIVAETYYHSLAWFYSRAEFERQVYKHRQKIQQVFGVTPTAFRGTELAYNDDIAAWAEHAGYKTVLAEGWDTMLGDRLPNMAYRPKGTNDIALLLKHYKLSDDLAFRFSDRAWEHYPLAPGTFTQWAQSAAGENGLVNLFMDYETFGEHQWRESGIFEFFEQFVGQWLATPGQTFATLGEAVAGRPPVAEIATPRTVTWADAERDLSAWLGNDMQQEAAYHLYDLQAAIYRTGDEALIDDWQKLQTSDHLYYMSTKFWHDGDVHKYFSPYESPYDACIYFMNALRDLRYRVATHASVQKRSDA